MADSMADFQGANMLRCVNPGTGLSEMNLTDFGITDLPLPTSLLIKAILPKTLSNRKHFYQTQQKQGRITPLKGKLE
jgi:hypothetical protein